VNRFLPFEWIAATRFLREGAAQSLLIITGVSIGIAVIVFMSALLAGLQANFLVRMFSTQAQIVLLPPDDVARPLRADAGETVLANVLRPSQRVRSLDQWQRVREELRRWPDVTAVSATVSGAAFVIRGDASKSITLTGIEPDDYFRIVAIPEKIVAGTPRLTSQDVLIGTSLADDLGVAVGDKIRISTAIGGSQTLTIAGIFDLGSKAANQRVVLVAMRTAQALIGLVGGATSIDVNVRDPYAAEDIAQAITAATGVRADSWIRTNADFFTFANAQTLSNLAIRLFVGISVAFGIASVLVVSVVQRSKEIGILRAMGASRGRILRVFLLQGAIVGFLGSLQGSALAAIFMAIWRAVARRPDGTPLFAATIDARLLVLTALLATVTGLLAALLPALRASRLDPVVAIRG